MRRIHFDIGYCPGGKTRRFAVFVDGDLWHGNPDEVRRRGTVDRFLAELDTAGVSNGAGK